MAKEPLEIARKQLLFYVDAATADALCREIPFITRILRERTPSIARQRLALEEMNGSLKACKKATLRALNLTDAEGLGLVLRKRLDDALGFASRGDLNELLERISRIELAAGIALSKFPPGVQVRHRAKTLPIRILHSKVPRMKVRSTEFESVVRIVYEAAGFLELGARAIKAYGAEISKGRKR